jgi:hypothetical protein
LGSLGAGAGGGALNIPLPKYSATTPNPSNSFDQTKTQKKKKTKIFFLFSHRLLLPTVFWRRRRGLLLLLRAASWARECARFWDRKSDILFLRHQNSPGENCAYKENERKEETEAVCNSNIDFVEKPIIYYKKKPNKQNKQNKYFGSVWKLFNFLSHVSCFFFALSNLRRIFFHLLRLFLKRAHNEILIWFHN